MSTWSEFLRVLDERLTTYPKDMEAIKTHPHDAYLIKTKALMIFEDSIFKPRYPLVYSDPNQPRGKIEMTSEEEAKRLGWNEL